MAELTLVPERKRTQYYVEDLGGGITMDMVLIPAGTFMMGSPEDERDQSDEGPQHEVTLPQFFMGRYPVTQAQWKQVAGMPEVNQRLEADPSEFKGDTHPVERVSWHDAVEFCARLYQHTNRNYRLPSEAEWEYACRAGTETPFYFGPTISTDLANYDGDYTYGDGPKGEYRKRTTPVDHFRYANAFGLHDMHGNVWEWCADHWHSNYEEAPTDGSAWIEGRDSDRTVIRGGSWLFNPAACRSAYRNDRIPAHRYYDIGFRVVVSAPGLRSP
ncbi:MAG: formylglycine-generating enzyme family protein [Leptolyngbyaceae bacterium]|nr:formylglycine-generating enzyme family protein [Leptolyngbyaceae bacterium]